MTPKRLRALATVMREQGIARITCTDDAGPVSIEMQPPKPPAQVVDLGREPEPSTEERKAQADNLLYLSAGG